MFGILYWNYTMENGFVQVSFLHYWMEKGIFYISETAEGELPKKQGH